jgi:hypothetical protein
MSITYLSVQGLKQTMSPAVAVIPIKASPNREQLVLRAGVCNVTNQCVDISLVGENPRGVQVSNDGRRIDKVPVMKMMVVVVGISKVSSRVLGLIRGR